MTAVIGSAVGRTSNAETIEAIDRRLTLVASDGETVDREIANEPEGDESYRHWANSLTTEPDEQDADPSARTGSVRTGSLFACSLADRPVMADEAYHGPAGDYANLWAPLTEADPVAILTGFLVAAGNAIGASPQVSVGEDHHPCRLFVVHVGDTAKGRKTMAWGIAKAPIVAASMGWNDRIRSGLSSGEGLIAAVLDPVYDDNGKLISASEDRRLMAVESEYGSVLDVATRTGNTITAKMRQAWDSGDISTLTREPLVAHGAHISLIGNITADELRAKLTTTQVADGFGNRHLWVDVHRTKSIASPTKPKSDELEALVSNLRAVLQQARAVGEVKRTREAETYWREIYSQMADDQPRGLIGHMIARDSAITLRLALIYCLLDGQKTISLSHLQAAHAVWRYSRSCVDRIFGDALGDPVADRLLEAIRAAGTEGLTGRQQSAVFSRHKNSVELGEARKRLERDGLIVTDPRHGDGGGLISYIR